MNTISLIIWTISALTNLAGVLGALSFISGAGLLLCLFIFIPVWADGTNTAKAFVSKWMKIMATVLAISTAFHVVIPDRQTLILIAASETSEFFLKTDAGKQMTNQVSGLSGESVKLLGKYLELQNIEITKQIENLSKPATSK